VAVRADAEGRDAEEVYKTFHTGFLELFLKTGLRADMKSCTSQEVRDKVTRLIDEPGFAQRARDIAAVLKETDGPRTAATLIERMTETGQPITRPDGYPLTIAKTTPMPWTFGQ